MASIPTRRHARRIVIGILVAGLMAPTGVAAQSGTALDPNWVHDQLQQHLERENGPLAWRTFVHDQLQQHLEREYGPLQWQRFVHDQLQLHLWREYGRSDVAS